VADGETSGPGYRAGVWSRVEGPAVSQGVTWAISAAPRPCLVVRHDGRLEIRTVAEPGPTKREVIAGNRLLIADGRSVAPPGQVRHPRTAVGLTRDAEQLILLVVDGRRPGVALGMSYEELTEELLRLGCHDALNLDGGGSSLLAVRQPGGDGYRILNQPTDGRERAVANVLGVRLSQNPAAPAGEIHTLQE
jgi:exopolysaccharide biosynthesis protein